MDILHGPRNSFEWDSAKAVSNAIKHAVRFEEACGVFYDTVTLLEDPIHSIDDERFVLLGFGNRLRLLVVVHRYRAEGSRIRIIGASGQQSERARYRDR